MNEDLDFIQYLEYLKDVSSLNAKEYENTKTEMLESLKRVSESVFESDVDVYIKKKIIKNLSAMSEYVQKMFTKFDESLKESDETFDRDLLIAKVDFLIHKIREHYNIIIKLAKN